jgi:L-alanine-DL-glutamate epimerase-like enolase superfamily enzyme
METYPSVSGHMAELVDVPEVEEGYITIPDRPGLGLGLDEDAVEKYRVT